MLRKLIKNDSLFETFSKSFIYLTLRCLGAVLAYAFAFFTVKFYGASTYGFVTLAFTILIITSSLVALGFDINLTKIFAEDRSIVRHGSKFYTSVVLSLGVSVIVCGAIYLNSDAIAQDIFNKPDFSIFLKWTAWTIPLWSLILLTTAVFRGLKNILLYSIFNSFGRFLLSIVILFALYHLTSQMSANDSTPIIAHFIGLVIMFTVAVIIVVKKIGYHKPVLNLEFKQYFNTTFPILISSVLVMVLAWVDKLFIGIFLDETLVGIYDIAARISILIGLSLDAINSILTPKISSAYYRGQLKDMQGEIDSVSKVSFSISLIVFTVILITNKYLLAFIGGDFLMGQTVLIIICIGQLVNSYLGPVWNIMQMTGQQKLLSKILGISLVINIVLNLILIKPFGIEGVAITTAFSFILWNIISSYYIYKRLGIRTFYLPKFILKYF